MTWFTKFGAGFALGLTSVIAGTSLAHAQGNAQCNPKVDIVCAVIDSFPPNVISSCSIVVDTKHCTTPCAILITARPVVGGITGNTVVIAEDPEGIPAGSVDFEPVPAQIFTVIDGTNSRTHIMAVVQCPGGEAKAATHSTP